MRPLRLLALSLALAACQSTVRPSQRSLETPFDPAFTPPLLLETARMRLEPLGPAVNVLDFEACQRSREHLSTTMQWGGWPEATMTLEDNLRDLVRHLDEFDEHEAYAYTVLAPEGEPVIGCVYLDPAEGDPRGMVMHFWVTEDQLATGLDTHLVTTVLEEVERHWPVDNVSFPVANQNPRGMEILADLGLPIAGETETHRIFAWRRRAE